MHSQPYVTFKSILQSPIASSSLNPNHSLFQTVCPQHHVQTAIAPMPNERGIGEPQTEVLLKFPPLHSDVSAFDPRCPHKQIPVYSSFLRSNTRDLKEVTQLRVGILKVCFQFAVPPQISISFLFEIQQSIYSISWRPTKQLGEVLGEHLIQGILVKYQ